MELNDIIERLPTNSKDIKDALRLASNYGDNVPATQKAVATAQALLQMQLMDTIDNASASADKLANRLNRLNVTIAFAALVGAFAAVAPLIR